MQLSSEQALEFDSIRLLLAECTATPLGRELAEAVKPTSRNEILEAEHALLKAYRNAAAAGLKPDFAALAEIDPETPSLPERWPVLEPLVLYQLASALQEASAASQILAHTAEEDDKLAPLAVLAAELETEDWLTTDIVAAIDSGGELLDDASPELARLRKALRKARIEINKILRHFFDPESFPDYVQDDFITIRGGRLVIPIRIEHRNRHKGIVHDRSRSGDSLFFEPMEAVEYNNELANIEGEAEIEEARILARLTGLLYENWDDVTRALRAAARLDLLNAKARLAALYEGVEPDFESNSGLRITGARHPLLDEKLDRLARHAGISFEETPPCDVVPIDIEVGDGWNVLVVTGPNAGGKTVTLKTAGLLALMAQSGLQVPARSYTAPVFDTISADIGDYQNITSHLSTFSSHIARLKRLFERMRQPALVLLDEIATATDPGEGAALAMAVLQQLREEGAFAIATTHLDAIKAFAHAEEGMNNACVEFDAETLKPTYRLRYGLPGRSNAMETAREMGLPEPVLKRAQEFLGGTGSRAAEVIGKLQAELDALRLERARLDQEREALEATRKHYVERIDEADAKEQRRLKQIEAEWHDFRRQQENALAEALRTIKEAQTREVARAAANEQRHERDEGFEVLQAARRIHPEAPADDGGPLAEGQQVQVPGFGLGGIVARAWDGEGSQDVLVEIGGKRLSLPRSAVVAGERKAKKSAAKRGSRSAKIKLVAGEKAPKLELKVIGMKVADAIDSVDRFLDEAMLLGTPWVRIIHGHGTGALRRAIGEHLRNLPYVQSFGAADGESGGDAVTVVQFGK